MAADARWAQRFLEGRREGLDRFIRAVLADLATRAHPAVAHFLLRQRVAVPDAMAEGDAAEPAVKRVRCAVRCSPVRRSPWTGAGQAASAIGTFATGLATGLQAALASTRRGRGGEGEALEDEEVPASTPARAPDAGGHTRYESFEPVDSGRRSRRGSP